MGRADGAEPAPLQRSDGGGAADGNGLPVPRDVHDRTRLGHGARRAARGAARLTHPHRAFPRLQVRAAFLGFSVEGARCFKEDERQHLLGVIETGFGSLDTFDELVRSLFAESLEKGASFKLDDDGDLPPAARREIEC